MATVGVPPTLKAFDTVGFSTRIGIGEVAWRTAQIDVAPVLCFVIPFSMPANQVGMLLVILTRTSAAGATLAGGKSRLLRPTLDAAGKSTNTLFPSVPEFAAPWVRELLYPLSEA
jgi:hypothetical protein